MIACHALFNSGSSISACEVLAHTGATYSAIDDKHRASSVVLIWVPYFELDNFIKRLFRLATFIFVLCMYCL